MPKTAHPDDLVHAVRVVARGDAHLEPGISRRLIEHFVQPAPTRREPVWAGLLTERERDVLRLMAQARSNAEIARELFLSEATVKTHVAGVLTSLPVRDRMQAVVAVCRRKRRRPWSSPQVDDAQAHAPQRQSDDDGGQVE